jgi:hypothetical protein
LKASTFSAGSDERQTYKQVVQANTVQTPVTGDVHRTSVVSEPHRGHARETFFIVKLICARSEPKFLLRPLL